MREYGYQPSPCEKKPSPPTSDTNVTHSKDYWSRVCECIHGFVSGEYDLNRCIDKMCSVIYDEVIKEVAQDIIAFAERRRNECVKHDEWDNLRYWIGYIDGAKRAFELLGGAND